MPLGVEIRNLNAPSSRGAPVDTDTLFLAIKATTGPTDEAVEIRSIGAFEGTFGARNATSDVSYDAVDTFLREAGRRVYVGSYGDGLTLDLADALALFPKSLGPGQVAAPDETPGAPTYTALLAHAKANNRFALLDVEADDDTAAMEALGDAFTALSDTDYGMVVGPWLPIPAPAGVIGGTSRLVAGSAVAAALIARADALGNPNRAAAGRDFPLQYVTSVPTITDADRVTLLDAGVNTFADRYGVLQLYGFQTGVAQTPDSPFWQANVSRARMWLTARAEDAAEAFMFKPITPRLAGQLKHALEGILLDLYGRDGLFGDAPADAFAVEVGASVNTVNTIAQGELHAVAECRFSLHAKRVLIDLVSVPVTGSVSA